MSIINNTQNERMAIYLDWLYMPGTMISESEITFFDFLVIYQVSGAIISDYKKNIETQFSRNFNSGLLRKLVVHMKPKPRNVIQIWLVPRNPTFPTSFISLPLKYYRMVGRSCWINLWRLIQLTYFYKCEVRKIYNMMLPFSVKLELCYVYDNRVINSSWGRLYRSAHIGAEVIIHWDDYYNN